MGYFFVRYSYLHHDQLGSIIAISDQLGAVVERMAYDPWGKRRFVNGKPDTLDAITGKYIDRGFTMHEHMDEMGIINMNGRIYDPLIGRFMSADPYIQAPDDLQSHNRYAYVMNNPLNLDDPSGYFSISRAWKRVWKNPIFKAIVGIAVAIIAPQFLAPIFGTTSLGLLATSVATGALSGFASTGTLKGALTGAFTAGIMFGAGSLGEVLKGAGFDMASGGIGKTLLHAGAGCLSSVAGGGSCKSGAISGGLGELGNLLPNSGKILNTAKAAMLGGIGSKIAGGKFEDGATTGAFGYLFNELLHAGSPSEAMKRSGYRDGGCSHPCDPPLEGSYPVEEFVIGGGLAKLAGGALLSSGLNGGANTVFWSGGEKAALYARNFGTTLELTPVGRVMDFINNGMKIPLPRGWWDTASATLATNAQGAATMIQRGVGNSASTWARIEKPILSNRNIPINTLNIP